MDETGRDKDLEIGELEATLERARELAREVEPFPTPAVVRLCRFLLSGEDDSPLAR